MRRSLAPGPLNDAKAAQRHRAGQRDHMPCTCCAGATVVTMTPSRLVLCQLCDRR